METYTFSKKEEIIHAITHGIGTLLSIAGLVLLIVFAASDGDIWKLISGIVFGTTMLFMYLSSTIVHSLPNGKWKNVFQIVDHSFIYFFIAGTYTPLLLVHLRDSSGWILFATVWGIALAGIIFKIFFVKKFLVLSTLIYIAMGWLIIFAWKPLAEMIHGNGLALLVAGGIFYTVGAVFYMWRRFPYHHAVWHLFVIAGSSFHFFSILYYVI